MEEIRNIVRLREQVGSNTSRIETLSDQLHREVLSGEPRQARVTASRIAAIHRDSRSRLWLAERRMSVRGVTDELAVAAAAQVRGHVLAQAEVAAYAVTATGGNGRA